jgi:hypothetical protein
MNSLANIWQHPRTSVAGVLIALVTIAGVLSQQGVTLGHAGAGTVVSLIGALATALLGLLARDPVRAEASSHSTEQIGAWALILLLLPAPWMAGCSGGKVAQDIVNWTPVLLSAVASVDATASLLDPKDAPLFTAATAGFNAAGNLLTAQAKAYLANPSASNLAQLQTLVVTLQQQVNSSLLAAAKIVDPASQQRAITTINAVATAVSAILALVQSISSKSAVAGMAAQAKVKLTAVQPLMDSQQTARLVAAHYDEPLEVAQRQISAARWQAIAAGF